MKKDNTVKTGKKQERTIGMDLGDRSSRYCRLDSRGEVLVERSVATTKKGLRQVFGALARSRVAIEVGTHSPWVSRLLRELGHEVIVANARPSGRPVRFVVTGRRRVRLITQSSRKNDKLDARTLARLARIDPELLSPIRHRSEQAQAHLMVIRARAALVEARTQLVNAGRGLVKSFGERLHSCDADQMRPEVLAAMPEPLRGALEPLLAEVESLTGRIREYDAAIGKIAHTHYPETELLRQVKGVGPLIALTYILTLDDPQRFARSRDVGAICGLATPAARIGEQPAAVVHQQGGRRVFAEAAGTGGALHSGPVRAGHRSAALGPAAGRARRQECQKAGTGGGGAEVGGAPAPAMGDGRSLCALRVPPGASGRSLNTWEGA